MRRPDYTDVEVLVADVALQVRKLRGQLTLVEALHSSPGAGRTYIPPATLEKMGAQHVQARTDRRRLEIASNAAAPVLSSKSPTNMATFTLVIDITHTAHHHLRRLVKWHRRDDTAPPRFEQMPELTSTQAVAIAAAGLRRNTPAALVDALYELLWTTHATGLVKGVAADVEVLTRRAGALIDGEDRRSFPGRCPHCGGQTLVLYTEHQLITCERPRRPDGTRPPCVCASSVCTCHHDPAYVHSWTSQTSSDRPDSWAALARHNRRLRLTKD